MNMTGAVIFASGTYLLQYLFAETNFPLKPFNKLDVFFMPYETAILKVETSIFTE